MSKLKEKVNDSIKKENKTKKQVLKNELKNTLKGEMIKIAKIIIIIAVVLIFLVAAYYVITMDDGTWKDKENSPKSYTNNIEMKVSADGNGYEIASNKEKILENALLNLGYEQEEINIMTLGEKIVKCEIAEDILKLAGKEQDEIKKMTEEEMISFFDSSSFNFDEVCDATDIVFLLNPTYSSYLDNSDQLEYLVNAEIITQYPNMKKEDDGKIYTTDEELLTDTTKYTNILDGIINFSRPEYLADGEYLEFIEKSEFESMLQNGNKEVLKKFTFDEDSQNIIVAYWEEKTVTFNTDDAEYEKLGLTFEEAGTTYTLYSRKIDYKSMLISRYNLPFNYLWAFLVVGRDYEFVSGLAKLAYDSEIVITIYDNLTTVNSVDTYTYDIKKTGNKKIVLKLRDDVVLSLEGTRLKDINVNQNIGTKNINYTIVNKVNTINVVLTKADVWLVEYINEYSRNQEPEQVSKGSSTIDKSDPIKTEKYRQTENLASDSDASSFQSSNSQYYNLSYIDHDYKYYVENLKVDNVTKTNKSSYQEGTPTVSAKVNPEGGQIEVDTQSGSASSQTINYSGYKVVPNAINFSNYVRSNNFYQSANQSKWGDSCLEFSQVYCAAILKNNFNIINNQSELTNGNTPRLPQGISYDRKEDSNLQNILKEIYNNINSGKPCILQVNGNTEGTSRHYVAVIGYNSNVTSGDSIKETDLMILDVWSGKVEELKGKGSETRFITKGTETGWPNYEYQMYYIK